MTRVALEIARAALPPLAEATDNDVIAILHVPPHQTVKVWRDRLGYYPSSGEIAAIDAARALETVLERCDSDTIGQVLEVVDRVRASMVA